MRNLIFITSLLLIFSCSKEKKDHQIIRTVKATKAPIIDGKALDACWSGAKWHALDQLWLGNAYSNKDFSGKYKLVWTPKALYLLAEIVDDRLFEQHEDPLELYWDDDCLEIFVDEDNSGGPHQYSHNAFAYHIALDGNVVDFGPDKKPHLYNDHVRSKRITDGNTSIWEVEILLFKDSFKDGEQAEAIILKEAKKIGFALAYCDNDGSKERENFIGSVFVPGEDKNQGWITADIFGTLVLED